MRVLKKLFFPSAPASAGAAYIALLGAARNPFFFGRWAVPDTLDGRFELIVLHLALLQHRLREIAGAKPFAQGISEAFINDMDRALRELGVLNPGRRIKRMSKAYHGRLQAYGVALTDHEQLKAALARNLYGTVAEGDVAVLDTVARYMQALAADLARAPDETIFNGAYAWPEPSALS